jgi:hypothetical protein
VTPAQAPEPQVWGQWNARTGPTAPPSTERAGDSFKEEALFTAIGRGGWGYRPTNQKGLRKSIKVCIAVLLYPEDLYQSLAHPLGYPPLPNVQTLLLAFSPEGLHSES